jgi:hypothetical protein
MADTNPDNLPELSAEQWAKEVGQLDSISAEKEIYVEIWWQFGYLRANAFRFQVRGVQRNISIRLSRENGL